MGKRYKYRDFKPVWEQVPPPKESFRSVLKWGNPNEFKEPNERLYKYMKTVFGIGDDEFKQKKYEGLEPLPETLEVKLEQKHIEKLKEIFGDAEVSTRAYDRIAVAYGKTMYDAYRLREGIVENVPDIVVFPSEHKQIVSLVEYCNENKIPLYVYGGGSSVTRGVEAVKGGITLDMRKNFNKVLEFNEINQTVTVQAGMSGPQLEAHLNNARQEFGACRSYTCGHFPQSFEYSSVGGWVVTRGAGQNSTYYGNIKDIVFQQTYVTPTGIVKSYGLPAHAVGPDTDEIMMGSEGAFGILTNVTLRIFRYRPETRKNFSFIFKTWENGMNACREIMQNEAGFPSVFRLSDAEETDMALKLYGVEGTIAETAMNLMGYKPMQRCLFLGWTEGEKHFSKQLYKNVKKICKKYGGLFLTGMPVKGWEHGRFTDPYLRESLQDYGVIIDTMECSVTWEMMERVHKDVRKFAKSRPNTVCMTHLSHAYPQGANLYFIFIGLFKDKEEYVEYQYGIFDNIMHTGAAMSHHHGVGKMTAAWVEQSIGAANFKIFKALKHHFDPNNIMNPGGTLGLDMSEEQKRKPKYAGKTWNNG
ncbi:FAD-binding oxidoreductase [Treponema pedis]|uniref:FAD-binding oxidoreductase n=1 Tax=Treponema pedis TaxID=409322 RepID=UPI00197D9559|nr:FAD-binding oxidoreductase [Treponema pedis]QSI03966.1 FAD-binding oxidoreductase [Treponema pedis]